MSCRCHLCSSGQVSLIMFVHFGFLTNQASRFHPFIQFEVGLGGPQQSEDRCAGVDSEAKVRVVHLEAEAREMNLFSVLKWSDCPREGSQLKSRPTEKKRPPLPLGFASIPSSGEDGEMRARAARRMELMKSALKDRLRLQEMIP